MKISIMEAGKLRTFKSHVPSNGRQTAKLPFVLQCTMATPVNTLCSFPLNLQKTPPDGHHVTGGPTTGSPRKS
jgi:hypothetical protein